MGHHDLQLLRLLEFHCCSWHMKGGSAQGAQSPPESIFGVIGWRMMSPDMQGSFISPIILRFYVRAMTPREVSDNMVGTFLEPELHKHLKFLEGELQHSNYFAGTEFTAADIQITFVLEMVEVLFPVAKQYPKLGKFLETVQARPAYKQALDKTGRYQLSDFSPVLN